ncbi:MAG: hemolysin family protein [Actinomycetota bacterium]
MGSLWLELGLLAVLIAVNALLAGSEIALVSLREGQIDRLAKRGRAGLTLSQLARDPNRFLATIQVGITLAGFLASATAAVSIARPLFEPLSFLGQLAEPASIVVVTLVLAYVTLVFGELAPKRVALQRSEAWSLFVARPLVVMDALARPLVWLLSKSTDAAVRVMGGDPSVRREELSKEDLRDMVSSRQSFHGLQRTIMSGAFEIAERSLRQIVVPRAEVVSVNAFDPVDQAVDRLLSSGLSRAPVTETDLDDTVGVVHLRELIGKSGVVRDHARPAVALPESLSVMEALGEMQRSRAQLAIVVDEYGGTEGIVTIEDLLEEVVGEIYDEFDRDIKGIQRHKDGSLVVSGEFPIHDLHDIGVSLPHGDYATIAGLIMDRLGRVPKPGEQVSESGWQLEVVDVAGRSIKRVRLTPPAAAPD